MDIGRTLMPNFNARERLDAGSYGTMGIGLGFAIAAATVHPDRPVVTIQGDCAFGFSGMELETAARKGLPLKIIILNNGGIAAGYDGDGPLPPHALMHEARYDKIAEAFGGTGFHVDDPADLAATLDTAMATEGLVVVNVTIAATAGKKPQKFTWLDSGQPTTMEKA